MTQRNRKEYNRKYPRMAADLNCTIARAGGNSSEGLHLRVKASNIGLGGLLIETETALILGEPLQILFMIDGQRIEAKGRVAYIKTAAKGGSENGVQFTQITDEHRDFLLAAILLQEHRDAE